MSIINLSKSSKNRKILIQTNIYDSTKIQYSTNMGTNWIDIIQWPVTFISYNNTDTNTKIELQSDLNIRSNITGTTTSGSDIFLIIGLDNITINGNGHIVTIDNTITNYNIFIQNNTKSNIQIKNITIQQNQISTEYLNNIIDTDNNILANPNPDPNLNLDYNFSRSQYTPLIFGTNTNFQSIKTILLIDSLTSEANTFANSVNLTTLPIIYSTNSDKLELVNFLNKNFTNIERIGFVFDDSNINYKQFLNSQLFFTPEDIINANTNSSNSSNFEFIKWMINKFNVTNIDWLVCNGLTYPNWVDYFKLLTDKTGVIVGASSDQTGNIKYGGDWILESTGQDIRNIYWTDLIENYSLTLANNSITTSTILRNATVNNYTWPITISGGTSSIPVIITLGDNITLSIGNNYFIIGSEYIIFEGGNKTVTIDGVTEYKGLIQNGTGSTGTSNNNGFSNITVNNIGVLTSNHSTLNNGNYQEGGWLCQCYWASNETNCRVNSCWSTGPIREGAGGIFGSRSSGSAIKCYSTGPIAIGAGGIFGLKSLGAAISCYSTGRIVEYAGGIFGLDSSGSATNCFSTETIESNAGGIFGFNSTGSATNCYVTSERLGGGTSVHSSTGNGTWSDSTAKTYLTGTPEYDSNDNLINPIGTVWADIDSSSTFVPWIFSTFGYSPYTNILTSTFEQTIKRGGTTITALNYTGHIYTIVSIDDSLPGTYPSILINISTGAITVRPNTIAKLYNIKVRENSNYTMTNFELTVELNGLIVEDPNKIVLYTKENKSKKYDLKLNINTYINVENYLIIKGPTYGKVKINKNNILKYYPDENYVGKDKFILGCVDFNGLSNEILFTVYIKPK